jgi:hypothetical protein
MDKKTDLSEKENPAAVEAAESQGADTPNTTGDSPDDSELHTSNIKDVPYEETSIQIIEESAEEIPSTEEIVRKMHSSTISGLNTGTSDNQTVNMNFSKQFFDPAANSAAAAEIAKEPLKKGIMMGILAIVGLVLVGGLVFLIAILFRVDYEKTVSTADVATVKWHEFQNEWQKLGKKDFGGTIVVNQQELTDEAKRSLSAYKDSLNELASSSGLRNSSIKSEYESLKSTLLDSFEKINKSFSRMDTIRGAYDEYKRLEATGLYGRHPERLVIKAYEALATAGDEELAEYYREFLSIIKNTIEGSPERMYSYDTVVIEGPEDLLHLFDQEDELSFMIAKQQRLFFTDTDARKIDEALTKFKEVVFDNIPRDIAVAAKLAEWRDGDRVDDIDKFISRVNQYQSDNRGKTPSFTEVAKYMTDYLGMNIEDFKDPQTGKQYNFLDSEEPHSIGDIQYTGSGFTCDGTNIIINSDSQIVNRSMAIRVKLENGSFYCRDNL